MKQIITASKKFRAGIFDNYVLKLSFAAFFFIACMDFACAKKKPSDPVLDFAKQQIAQKFYLPAISTINNYLETHPKDVDALYWKGFSFYHVKNYMAAEESYMLVMKMDAKYLPAFEDMANMQVAQKNYEKALPYFNAAIAIKDSDINLLNSRGMCFYYSDKFELAIKDFNHVLRLDQANYLAYNNKGSAEYNNQDIAAPSMIDLRAAEKDFNKSLELKPDFQLAFRNRGIVRYYMDSLNTSYRDLLYASQLDPTDEKAHYYLGKLLFKQNNYTIAMQFFDIAIKLVNYKPEMFLDRGICKMEIGNYSSARSDFYKAMQLADNYKLAEYQVARSFAAEANKKDAIYALREAKKMGLFYDIKYFVYMAKDKYLGRYAKDKEFIEIVKELKFGKNNK